MYCCFASISLICGKNGSQITNCYGKKRKSHRKRSTLEVKFPLIITVCLVYTTAEYWERKIFWTAYILSVNALALLFLGFYDALFQMSCGENRPVCLDSPHPPRSAFVLRRKCTEPASEFAVSSDEETASHLSLQNQRKIYFPFQIYIYKYDTGK